MEENQLLKNRFEELYSRSFNRNIWVYSSFLTVAEQALLSSMKLGAVEFFGGYSGAERRIACFGSEEMCGYEAFPPIDCVKIEPVQMKFADELSHRDFFGSVMALGIKREVLGDIIVHGNCGYLFCENSITDYIIENLNQVRRTTVKCAVVEAPPTESVALPEIEEFVVASERLDCLIASVYNISRSLSKGLVEQGRVSVNSLLNENPAAALAAGFVVSVRGKGRFIYEGIARETKKGKIRARVRVFK